MILGARNQTMRSTRPAFRSRRGHRPPPSTRTRVGRARPSASPAPARDGRGVRPAYLDDLEPGVPVKVEPRLAGSVRADHQVGTAVPSRPGRGSAADAGGRRARRGPEDGPPGPGSRHVQARIVGQRGAGADQDRVVVARSRWRPARASAPVIHWLSPSAVAIRPSSVVASLSVTSGRPCGAAGSRR